MATNPVPADMQSVMEAIAALTAQVTAITAQVQTLATASGNNATVATTASTFAMTPGQLKVEEVIDYSDKVGLSLWKAAIEALPTKFDMKASGTATFVEGMKAKAQEFGWSQGSKQITTFENDAGAKIDLIEQYGQITPDKLKVECERFITGVDKETRARQNNEMMHKCIMATLTTDAKLRLTPHRNDYTFHKQVYAPLLYKTVMKLAIIDSRATDQQLRDNLGDLASYMVSCKSDIEKFHQFFDANYSALIARGKTVDDPIGLLFDGYFAAGDHVFVKYMKDKQDEYFDNQVHMQNLTHEGLMAMAMAKYNYLVQREKWGLKSMEEEKIMALSAEVAGLKGELKLAKNVADKVDNGNKRSQEKKKKREEKKTKNKKSKKDKEKQKRDETWKKIPPSPKDPQEKVVNKITYHWCIHHMAWTAHKPEECRLGKDQGESLKLSPHATFRSNVATGDKSSDSSLRALMTQLAAASADES